MSFIPLFLQTSAASTTTPEGMMGTGLGAFIPLILILLIMYFFMIRPQTKKQKETEKMIAALKKGDKVITIGGIHGTVAAVKESTIILKVEDGSRIEFNRSAISSLAMEPTSSNATEKEEKKSLLGGKKAESRETKEENDATEVKNSSSDSETKTEAEAVKDE